MRAAGGRPASRCGALLRRAPAVLALALAAVAITVVAREFRHLRPAEILGAVRRIPQRAELAAAGWTVCAYLVLTCYDRLATAYAGARLPWRRTAFASFTAYVMSHNLGFSALSGGAVRFRLYTVWGLTPGQIARVVGFCSATFLLGAAAIGGGVALLAPGAVPVGGLGVPAPAIRAAGAATWLALAAYVGLSHRHGRVRIAGQVIELPGMGLAVRQVALAATDVGTTSAIAFTLLPSAPGLDYPRFLSVYLAAYTAGLAASVPGGLGVFETAMLVGLHGMLPPETILAAMLVFRLYYYIVPLFLAGAMFAAHELWLRAAPGRRRRLGGRRAAPALRATEADFSVAVATALTGLAGAALLLVGGLDLPRASLLDSGPALSMLASHAGSYALSLIGTALVVLAIGLSLRVTLAWAAAIVLLVFGAVVCLVEQLSPWVAGSSLLVALMMMPFRDSYHRRARLFAAPRDARTALTVLAFGASLAALVRLEPRFRYLDRDTWWQLVLGGALPDRVRIAMALLVAVLLLATWMLVRPGKVAWRRWDEACRRRFERSGAEAPRGADGVVFGEAGRSCLAFRRVGNLLVGLGDPAGHARDRVSAIRRLRDLAREEGRAAAAWGAGAELIGVWATLGLRAWPAARGYVCCGDEAEREAVVEVVERPRPGRAG